MILNHMGTIPLETQRLLLRRFTVQDAEEMYRSWACDTEVTRYMRWNPHGDVEETKRFLAAVVAGYDDPAAYLWAVQEKNGRLMGSVGVMDIHDGDGCAMLGYCLGRAFWNQGYMTEAVRAVMRYMFDCVGLNRIEAYHSVNNPASGRVLQKAGMTWEGFMKQKYRCQAGLQDCDFYGAVGSDWNT